MNLQELYRLVDGNYEDFISRIQKEERAEKYFRYFLKENHYEELLEAIEQEDIETAFRAVHTLKGICANLSLPKLLKALSELTELLREAKDVQDARRKLPEVTRIYMDTVANIQEYLSGCLQ